MKGKKKPEPKKTGDKRTGLEANLAIQASKTKKQKRKGTKGGDGDNAGLEGDDRERSNNAAIVKWVNPDLHYLTSNLINMISDNQVWRQAFNFDTSDSSEPINSGGKKTADHQHEIGRLLLQDDPSGQWADTDLKTLGIVIKNRINALKKKYLELFNELGSTGHGLIEEDREAEIWVDSAISNVWDKIQKMFPWYKELSALLKESPVVDKDAAANSMTELDLSFLMIQGLGAPTGTATPSNDEANYTEPGLDAEDLVEGVPGVFQVPLI
ncbi:hypothetical protein K439DRAFT_1611928 [Ramaria rubella]|nr:hypothetical protein K439DRAFT_1611928 [Ramaria rubella]